MPVSRQLLSFDVKRSTMKISFGFIGFALLLHLCWIHPASNPLRAVLVRQHHTNTLCSAVAKFGFFRRVRANHYEIHRFYFSNTFIPGQNQCLDRAPTGGFVDLESCIEFDNCRRKKYRLHNSGTCHFSSLFPILPLVSVSPITAFLRILDLCECLHSICLPIVRCSV